MLREPANGSSVPNGDGDGIAAGALGVLDANWTGRATMPSPALYPHQWSWDSACIAIGFSRLDQARAERELRALFTGQWRNGLLPHIVFNEGANYFPGPGVLADGALDGGDAEPADLGDRAAARARDRGAAGVRARARIASAPRHSSPSSSRASTRGTAISTGSATAPATA